MGFLIVQWNRTALSRTLSKTFATRIRNADGQIEEHCEISDPEHQVIGKKSITSA